MIAERSQRLSRSYLQCYHVGPFGRDIKGRGYGRRELLKASVCKTDISASVESLELSCLDNFIFLPSLWPRGFSSAVRSFKYYIAS